MLNWTSPRSTVTGVMWMKLYVPDSAAAGSGRASGRRRLHDVELEPLNTETEEEEREHRLLRSQRERGEGTLRLRKRSQVELRTPLQVELSTGCSAQVIDIPQQSEVERRRSVRTEHEINGSVLTAPDRLIYTPRSRLRSRRRWRRRRRLQWPLEITIC